MIQPVTIPKALPDNSALSYEFLRQEGVKHIQQLAGQVWSDHNAHDPGITLLEQLCYAITDLSYRIDNDMKDLLGSNNASSYVALYSAATVLTTNPVTLQDIRKLVIDVPGVKNAWVEKVIRAESPLVFSKPVEARVVEEDEATGTINLKGLYRVVFEKEESYGLDKNLLSEVKKRLQECRSVCEDFDEITQLEDQFICLHGTIEVGEVEDMVQFAANILLRAATCISPKIPFYTLQQMLDNGKRIDEVFDGPALNHGFILDEDLNNGHRRYELRSSDLIRAIMDEKEVLAVNELSLTTGSDTVENWVLKLDTAKTPKLQVRKSLESLRFVKQGLDTAIDIDRIERLYVSMRDAQQYAKLPLYERDLVQSETADCKLASYYSIQNQLPANYGIGLHTLPDTAPATRKAQAKQLKGYLLFFEQQLANYFSEIAHFRDLAGFEADSPTWFTQSLLSSVPGIEEVLQSTASYEAYLEETVAAGNASVGLTRKNLFLNHLLARFGETFTDYAMLLQDARLAGGYNTEQKLISDKSNFLKNYPAVSNDRARAGNVSIFGSEANNRSGLEKRIALKLGIEDLSVHDLGESTTEGFRMVEHILLRPNPGIPPPENEDDDLRLLLFTTNAVDPYSLQVTFVLPDWTGRFTNANFKKFVERTIREESPVHVTTYIQWLNRQDMKRFDKAYRKYFSPL